MFPGLTECSIFNSLAFGIIAMVIVGASWCLVGLVMGDAPKRGIEPSLVQFFGVIFSVAVSLILLVATNGFPHCSGKIILLTCGCIGFGGFLNFFMLQIMSYAMQRGPNGIIWAVIQSALVFPFLGGILFFNVQLTWLRGTGIAALLIALILFALTKSNEKQGKKWLLPALCCLLLAAIQQNLTTLPSYFSEAQAVSSIVRSLAAAAGTMAGALIWNACRMNREYVKKLKNSIRNRHLWRYIAALQFFNLFFAYTLFYSGMSVMAAHQLGGMCYPMMVGACIISFTGASILILKEKFTPLQGIALLVCTSGLILLCTPA